jgi:hypothetical protein
MKWFNHEPFHNAYVGEENFLKFITNWLNLASTDNCLFADRDKIFNGDMTELRGYLADKETANNEVTVYLDVTENKGKYYQSVYTNAMSRPTAKNPEAIFAKAFGEQYGKTKSPFTGFELKVFYPKIHVDTPDEENLGTAKRKSDFV